MKPILGIALLVSALAAALLLLEARPEGARALAPALHSSSPVHDAPLERESRPDDEADGLADREAEATRASTVVGVRTDASAPLLRYSGVVADPAGAPIADAELRLHDKTEGWAEAEPLARAHSDEAGRFELVTSVAPTGVRLVVAEASGFFGRSIDPVEPDEEMRLELLPIALVHGRVTELGSGAPIAGATVSCGAGTALTDEQGVYRDLPMWFDMRVQLVVRHATHVEERIWVELHEGDTHRPIDVQLDVGAVVTITLLDLDERTPVGGGEWCVLSRGNDFRPCDEDGRFQLRTRAGEELYLQARAPGYATVSWSGACDLPEELDGMRLPMQPLAWFEGHVRDVDGSPVSGARLSATNEALYGARRTLKPDPRGPFANGGVTWLSPPDEPACRTDAQGAFRLPVLPDPLPYVVEARAPDRPLACSDPLVADRARLVQAVELQLVSGGSIEGTAFYNEEPCAGASVLAIDQAGRIVASARVASDGRYSLSDVPPGTVDLKLRQLPFRGSVPPSGGRVEVVDGATARFDFVWSETLAPIEGCVRSIMGSPIVGSSIRVTSTLDYSVRLATRTDAQGNYSIEVPTDREYTVSASYGPLHDMHKKVAAGTSGVDFDFRELGRLRLRLVDAESGEPVRKSSDTDGEIHWFFAGEELSGTVSTTIDQHGRVEFGVPLGRIDLRIWLQEVDYAPAWIQGLVVEADGEEREIALSKGGTVELLLRCPDGVPRAHAPTVLLLHEDELQAVHLVSSPAASEPQRAARLQRIVGRHRFQATRPDIIRPVALGGAGVQELESLPPGTYHLRAYPEVWAFTPATLHVSAGEVVRAEVSAAPR